MSISLAVSSATAIANYDDLIDKVQTLFLDRDDLAAEIPTFILLSEADMNRELRCPEMEDTYSFSVTSEDTPLPEDMLAMRAIYREASPDTPLKAMAPTALKQEYSGTTGTPKAYSLVGGGIRVAPPPANEETLTMDYFAAIPNLSVEFASNWVLEKHPALYLHGTLFYAYMALDNEQKAQSHKFLFDSVLAAVNRQARNNRFGGGPLVPNTAHQVRSAKC